MNLGDTFVNLNPGSPPHLWVVISDETPDGWLIVNLSSRVPNCEETCVVQPREHPWLKWESIVVYARSQMLSRRSLDVMKQLGCYDPKDTASSELVRKIQDGAMTSSQMKLKHQKIVREFRSA